ncbi:alpha-N-acetylgalactosaminide alpha-2,6-sialyltransferase 1-like [Amphiura filiformis]|uniref:alpha-N-acetylgalactosaminide alpha-2,6-sialyltransferase 1-like n=1 Tax=Amphiura filiformis TaxID=82378 RepID=UPI003B219514
MLGRILRHRPVQLALIVGLGVYAFLTVAGLLLRHRNQLVPAEPLRSEQRARDLNQWYHKQDQLGQGEKLDEILQMLKRIKPDGQDNSLQVGAANADADQFSMSFLQQGSNNRTFVNVLANSAKRNLVDLKTVLEEPKTKPIPPKKVPLEQMEYMHEPHFSQSQCPKTLSSISKYSKWFREHYRPGVKVFTDDSDINNFDNYYKLAHYTLPFGFMRENRTLLGEIINHVNFTNGPVNRPSGKCVRCAVVGCGGILNGSNAGEEIDSHDYVFRLNRAISKGRHAQDVGTKTSFYTFFPESMHIRDVVDPNAVYLYTAFKKYDLEYALHMLKGRPPPVYISKGKKYKLATPGIDPGRLKMVHPDFFRYVFTHYLEGKGARPTTGALVVFLAVHLCDEVTIYGFGYDTRFTLHYYDTKFVSHTNKSTALHDVDNERELWMKLHEEGVIRLFKRDL